jgi:hypothetical protein
LPHIVAVFGDAEHKKKARFAAAQISGKDAALVERRHIAIELPHDELPFRRGLT